MDISGKHLRDILTLQAIRATTWLAQPTAPNSIGTVRLDRWVQLVIIALALILAVGLAIAWWITCQKKRLLPAVKTPAWKSGGTWKVYCAK